MKSEAELEEIADGLHEQEHEDKKMRSLTVVPPLLRDPSDTTPVYIDTNRMYSVLVMYFWCFMPEYSSAILRRSQM